MSSKPQTTPSSMDRKPKTLYQLESPFTSVSWPETSPENQPTILDLLCSILSPIGQHRSDHVTTSKGKRSQKRKRAEAKQKDGPVEVQTVPPQPEITSYVVVGLNNITRSLESQSRKSKPQNEPTEEHDSATNPALISETENIQSNQTHESTSLNQHFSAIYVPRSSQPPILHAHLPQLIATASRAQPELPATRLVQLPKGCDFRLCEALGLPRVSFIGILDGAPHAQALVDLVRECVPEIEIPWLEEVKTAAYMPVRINAVETFTSMTMKEQKVASRTQST